jgi:glutamine synthetase
VLVEDLGLVMFCCSDFAGQVRGKGAPLRALDKRLMAGIGWTPTNIMINCFGAIPATPWRANGDLVLRPAEETGITLTPERCGASLRFYLGNIEKLDGTPWECCPRSYLIDALARLKAEHGLRLIASFEHEFTVTSLDPRPGSAYGLDAILQLGSLPDLILKGLDEAGLGPETFLPEYSPGQFEFTLDPAPALTAADRAVLARQVVRTVASANSHNVSFSPIMRKGGVGNGVHIHFSFQDLDGNPVTYDPAKPNGISERAGAFVAGILDHGTALTAITAPTAISYERLRPNAWSASSTNLGVKDREAQVRLCPVSEKPGANVAKAFNFEYRAADAAASPFLALGAVVRAGLSGLDRALPTPQPVSAEEAEALPPEDCARLGLRKLPASLAHALDELEANDVLMDDYMRHAYLVHKRGELQVVEAMADDKFERYASVY